MSEPRRITERYRLEKRVSSKDSGSVFRAVDTRSGEIVAVKLINTGDSEEQRDPFEAHLAALQGVQHPALPRILDFGFTTAGSAFLITEYLVGDNLSELVDAPPARILALLLQLADGLEALAAHGLAVRSLSPDNLWLVPGPSGPDRESTEQVKILGLGGATFGAGQEAEGPRADLRAFADLAIQALNLPAQDRRDDTTISLPLHVAGSLTEPERLRELLDAALHGDPKGRFPGWEEVRQALRTALYGTSGQRREAKTLTIPSPVPPPAAGGTAQIPRKAAWEEVRLGQGQGAPPVWQEDPGDTTMAVERLGPAPAPAVPPSGTMILGAVPGLSATPGGTGTAHGVARPAPPAVPDLTTRIIRPEELDRPATAAPPQSPPPPPATPGGGTVRIEMPGRVLADTGRAGSAGTVRIPLKELVEPPPAEPLRFPAPVPPPPPAAVPEEALPPRAQTIPFPAPPQVAKPAPLPPPLPAPLPPQAAPPAAAQPAVPPPAIPPVIPPVIPSASPAFTPPPAAPPPVTAPAPAAPVPAAAPRAAKPPRAPGKSLRLALLIGIPVVLLLAVVGLVAWLSRRTAEPPPPPKQVQAPAPKQAPPPVQAPAAPMPVHAQILLAEESLNTSDLAAAKSALEAIPPEQIALFTSEEQERYQRALDALTPLQSQQWGETLARGLAKGGDLRLLRSAAGSPPDAATLTPEQKKSLARARKILDLDTKLSKAQRAKNHPDALRQAGLLLAELPGNTRAVQARTQAADALLAESDARAGQAQFEAALAALEHLRAGWKDHPGLADRLERVQAEKRADDQMEDALAAATRAEKAERPLEGLQALDRVRPNERFADRFQQARERLKAQATQIDQNPPQIAMTGPSELSYEKGATVTIPLRITDDQGVESVEAWVRPEGGRFTKTSVRHASGADYELQIGPDLHQNKNIDYYVTATDQSGHAGSLGSVQRPQKVKRKKWFDRIRGGGKEGE